LERSRRNGGSAVQFILLALVWGSSFLFMKIGLGGLSPLQIVLARLALGASTLLIACAVLRVDLPRQLAVWLHLVVVALLLCFVPFWLFAWAETRISSGLASIYNATTPLMASVIAMAALPEERPSRARLSGLLLGFIGVLLVLAPWRGLQTGGLTAQVACLAATACYGAAYVYLRRFVSPRGLPSLSIAAAQVTLAAIVAILASPWLAGTPPTLTPAVVASMIALGALGTGLAYVWNTNVVNAWGATNASTVTYLTPVVGVALGAGVLAEQVTWNQPLGALVVILGIVISQERHRPLIVTERGSPGRGPDSPRGRRTPSGTRRAGTSPSPRSACPAGRARSPAAGRPGCRRRSAGC
jgi:Permeases of the drug/metabolite transporter (DMT) superfamily